MDNTFLAEFITIASLHPLAVMSPGPDFVLISRNSLVYSRKTGVYTALGLALGVLVHITYSLVGIAIIISKSIIIFSTIKLLGAGYLIYIGYKSLKAKPAKFDENEIAIQKNLSRSSTILPGTNPVQEDHGFNSSPKQSHEVFGKVLDKWEAIKTGFLTNLLNPKVTLFFLALFSQVIHTTTPLYAKILYGAEMALMTFVWFSFVATVLSHQKIKKPFVKIQHYVERTMGGILIALGLKIALGASRQ